MGRGPLCRNEKGGTRDLAGRNFQRLDILLISGKRDGVKDGDSGFLGSGLNVEMQEGGNNERGCDEDSGSLRMGRKKRWRAGGRGGRRY